MFAAGRPGAMFAGRFVEASSVVAFLGWPEAVMSLEPVNDVAKQIAAYYAANVDHPRLPVSPWDLFTSAPYLPELPAVRPGPGNSPSAAAAQRRGNRQPYSPFAHHRGA
jgi:hypothetical protein